MRPLRILIWHVHGSYLYYLTSRSRHQFFLPSKPDRSGDYVGKWGHFPWGPNVVDVPVDDVRTLPLDCVIYQRPRQFHIDRFEILSPEQQHLPRIYLEHDPPCENPVNQVHGVDDPHTLLVHVTPFNALMWNNGCSPTMVIEHGVIAPPEATYIGDLERGLVVVNHLARRGRRLGSDVYESVRQRVPLDLIGMGAEETEGGLHEIRHDRLSDFKSRYRFFFNPIRYTSLGLSVIEAMMCGMPIVGLATTEMATAVENGVSGFVDTNVDVLVERMKDLLSNQAEARRLGQAARRRAIARFGIQRFTNDWDRALAQVCGRTPLMVSV